MFKDPIAVKEAVLHGFPRLSILVVGDVMLDRYIWGSCSRICPEAPVPVVLLSKRTDSPGGAANVANNLSALHVKSFLAGFVGADEAAEVLKRECRSQGIDVSGLVASEGLCTVTKTRIMADDRQVVRLDEEIVPKPSEARSDLLLEEVERILTDNLIDAIVLSDYAKGVCTPYLCGRLMEIAKKHRVPVFVDPKGRDYMKYAGATAIKPNRVEMVEVGQAMGWSSNVIEAAQSLRETLDLEFVALTLGAHGIALVERDSLHEMPTVAREVFDVSGAGDTVIACLVAALCCNLSLAESAAVANLGAAQVIARLGSTPVSRPDLLAAVTAQERSNGLRKLYSLEDLVTLAEAWRREGKTVAITNGCYDLLHAGHVRLLEDSAMTADRLIVAINSDESVKRLKGPSRPLMPEPERVTVLSALECIDAVVVFEEDTPLNVITAIRPDALIKGGDYTKETVVGADVVESYGGRIVLIPLVPGLSTTNLAAAISKL